MRGALYYHFFQLRKLLQIILTTFQAEPLSLFSEFSTIVMVDCSFSSYTYMNGLYTGPEKDKFWRSTTLSKSSETYSPLFKIFKSNRQFQKRMKLFSLYDFWPFHFLNSKQNHDKKLDRIHLFIYYNFYLF